MPRKVPYVTDYQFGIGAMTGTSLDGLDLALCKFENGSFELLDFECLDCPKELRASLNRAAKTSAEGYVNLELAYSRFVGDSIKAFHAKTGMKAQFSGIHGQTVFHNPKIGLTSQLLNGGMAAALSGLTTVCDFRRADIALGGEGAPLVPIGDRDLFAEYGACLNLGGFANISLTLNGSRSAYDICPVNYVLNHLAGKEGKEYDDGGKMASAGLLNEELLQKLNAIPFYAQKPPKSLGREWVEANVLALTDGIKTGEALRTFAEHAAYQISQCLPTKEKVLVTGGGAYNSFLISLLEAAVPETEIVIPEKNLLEGKEALIFAYLAKLRLEEKPNVLASATGASRDSCSGAVYLP